MDVTTLIGIALIAGGAAVMAPGLYRLRPLWAALPLVGEPPRTWLGRLIRVDTALATFFLAGYAGDCCGVRARVAARRAVVR